VQKKQEVVVAKTAPKKIRKKAWYEKFKWFISSNEMLVIAGRDATTNEILIKKHVDATDIVFHTDAPGSPFVVIKSEGKQIPEEVLAEAASFCAAHSKAWKAGIGSTETYWVTPEQVTKEAKAGEYMVKGSFMVYGKRNYVQPEMKLAACLYQDTIMVGPVSAIHAQAQQKVALIVQGDTKTSDAAKKVLLILGSGEPDDVIRALPSGGCKVLEQKTQ